MELDAIGASFHLTLTRLPSGFAFSLGPSDPRYRLDVNGVFPNGSIFFLSNPVTDAPVIKTKGEAVSGQWGTVGSFDLSGDRSHLTLTFNGTEAGPDGYRQVHERGNSRPWTVQRNRSASLLHPLAAGKKLNPNETILYERDRLGDRYAPGGGCRRSHLQRVQAAAE